MQTGITLDALCTVEEKPHIVYKWYDTTHIIDGGAHLGLNPTQYGEVVSRMFIHSARALARVDVNR